MGDEGVPGLNPRLLIGQDFRRGSGIVLAITLFLAWNLLYLSCKNMVVLNLVVSKNVCYVVSKNVCYIGSRQNIR